MIRKLLKSAISIAVSELHINICNNFQALWQNSEKRLLDSPYLSVCLSVRPSVRMEHLGSHGMNFHEFDI